MTTQLVNSLTVDERIKTQAESAAEVLATSNAPHLVSSLTVDELKEVIANVVDARLNSFFSSLNTNGIKKSSESETLESTEVEKENPWLKMAGKYENDPYFEQMLEDIADYRREQDAELEEYYRQMEIAENNVNSTNLVAEVAAL
ncbi:MAG: hypothetical protein WCP16_12485 [Pseudanabaena sp. ELA645]